MKCFSLIPIAILSVTLQGQTGAVQPGHPMASPASVSAELAKGIDTKKAKVGDEVEVKTTSTAKLPDGTELPKGTKLTGKVTDVKAKSKEDKSAHLAFSIDHAVLKDGKQVPVAVIMMSVTGPSQGATDAMMPGAGASPSSAGGSQPTSGKPAPAPSLKR